MRTGRMRVSFGEFQLDLTGCVLTRTGHPLSLERRPTELLCLLAGRPAELVGRRELADKIWGASTNVDADMGINTAIRKIRAALGDTTGKPVYIETVQGRGYRFIAPIQPEPIADVQTVPRPVTIAVLPFDNLTGSGEHDYLSDGFTEELIAVLGTVAPGTIHVIGRRSVMQFRAKHADTADIGRVLGANYLLEGSFRLDGSNLRVTTRLVEATTQHQTWSESFDSKFDQKLAFQQSVSRTVSQTVRALFAPQSSIRQVSRHTQSEAAYELYLRGRYCWNRNQSAMTAEAIGYFSRATAADPDYALAWSGLADSFSVSPVNGDAPALVIWEKARQAASNAVRAAPALAEARTSLGFVYFWLDWRWQDAVAEFRAAASLDPNYAFAHRMVGIACSHLGLHEEARQAIRLAIERDPLFAMHHTLSAVVALHAGAPAEAASFARDAIEVDSEFWIGHFLLAQALEQCGEFGGALAALAIAGKICGNSTKPAMLAAYIYARSGNRQAAHAQLDVFAAMAQRHFVPPYARGLIYAGLDDTAASLEALEHGLLVRDVNLCFLPCDPKWSGLRELPPFRALIHRCGFSGNAVLGQAVKAP